MAKSPSANYSREKSRYGGFTGSIQIHSVPGIGVNNDPSTAVFKDNLPAGYLRCDGSVKNVREYYALAQVLGIGDECRFKKENTILRNANPEINDLGSFQLPDLGSKVILAGRAPGEYNNDFVDNRPNVNRVGVLTDANSNVGDTVNVNYIGNMRVQAQPEPVGVLGNGKFNLIRQTSGTALTIENFEGHLHNANQYVLNYTGTHATDGQGKGSDPLGANSGGGNVLEESESNTDTSEPHKHTVIAPTAYTPLPPFTYQYSEFEASMENIRSFISVKPQNIDVLNQVVTPFILVEYIIKF